MVIREQSYSTIEEAGDAVAQALASTLSESINERGGASLVVSGGQTPKYVFKTLRNLSIEWKKVTITLTDERWIGNHHPESNENLVRTHLLCGKAESAAFIPFFGGEASPEEGRHACESRLKQVALPFDAIYLGMGADGHIASLFPNDPAFDVSSVMLCVPVSATQSRLARMSLTPTAILRSRKIFLFFSGPEKYQIYLKAKNKGSNDKLPLQFILMQHLIPVYVIHSP